MIQDCYSKSDICRKFDWPINGSGLRKAQKFIDDNDFDISHFDTHRLARKWKIIKKKCPVCSKIFETQDGHPREKTTCSYSCSNTYFRSGKDNPNYNPDKNCYRTTCFENYEHICQIPDCNWSISLDVHHIDGDHSNNDPKNLIPLCANHHKLTVMIKHKEEINKIIYKIVEDKFGS